MNANNIIGGVKFYIISFKNIVDWNNVKFECLYILIKIIKSQIPPYFAIKKNMVQKNTSLCKHNLL